MTSHRLPHVSVRPSHHFFKTNLHRFFSPSSSTHRPLHLVATTPLRPAQSSPPLSCQPIYRDTQCVIVFLCPFDLLTPPRSSPSRPTDGNKRCPGPHAAPLPCMGRTKPVHTSHLGCIVADAFFRFLADLLLQQQPRPQLTPYSDVRSCGEDTVPTISVPKDDPHKYQSPGVPI